MDALVQWALLRSEAVQSTGEQNTNIQHYFSTCIFHEKSQN